MRMLQKQRQRRSKLRKYVFNGTSSCDSILIGNHGDAKLLVNGQFNLSGILYSLDGCVRINAVGDGQLVLRGKCRHLVIGKSDGDCILDFAEVSCDVITCESVKGRTSLVIGKAKRVDIVNISEQATIRIYSHPFVTARNVADNARILCSTQQAPPLVVHTGPGVLKSM